MTEEQKEKLACMVESGDDTNWRDILTEEQSFELQAEIDRVEARVQRALARVQRSETIVAQYRHHFYGG